MNEQINPYKGTVEPNKPINPDKDKSPTAAEISDSLGRAADLVNIALKDPEFGKLIETFDNSRPKLYKEDTDQEALLKKFILDNNPTLGKLGIQSLGLVIDADRFGKTFGQTSDVELSEIVEGFENKRQLDEKTRELKRATTLYNEKIRNYLFQYPDTSIKDVVNLFTEAWLNHNPDITRDSAENTVTEMVRGALHEVLFEYVVSDLCKSDSRFTFRRATNEEDSRGVDFYVYIDGIEFRIDIKASKYKFNNRDTDSKIERQKDGKYLLCLFTRKDESKATLDPETQTAYAEELKKILETLFENMNANKNYHNLAA